MCMKKVLVIFGIVLIFFLVGCNYYGYEKRNASDDKKELEFICNVSLESCDEKMSIYKSESEGITALTEYKDLPSSITEIHTVKRPLSIEELYACLKVYFENTDYYIFFEDGKCVIEDYIYEYITIGYDGELYFIPVVRFSVKSFGDVFLDLENGCMIR